MCYTKKYRILIVIPGKANGQEMIFARRQAAALIEAGFDIHKMYIDVPESIFEILALQHKIRKTLKKLSIDVVHVHYGTITAFSVATAGLFPLLVTFHGSDLNIIDYGSRLRVLTGHLLSQFAALRCRKIICVSKYLIEHLWWCRKKAVVIPMGIDTELFKPLGKDFCRKQLNWNSSEKIVLFNSGKYQYIKGADIAEKVIAKVQESIGEVRYAVMNGDVAPDEVPLYLSGADCLLVTSRHEGSPMIVKEAMACNLPIISVDVGDVKDRLCGVKGCYIVENDISKIASKLISVLQDSPECNGRAALFEQQLDNDGTIGKLTAVYRSVSL
jgi:glycosyltransferase involved in cell wall biosynthesis